MECKNAHNDATRQSFARPVAVELSIALAISGSARSDSTKADYVEKSLAAPKPNARNTRALSKKQIRQIADIGFLLPILIDEGDVVIAGHARYGAAKLLDLKEVPATEVQQLSECKRRALAIADNEIAENAGWSASSWR